MKLLVLSLTCLLIIYSNSAIQAASEMERESLHGIATVYVVVSTSERTVKYGLSSTLIQTDVELRLRKAGIRVLTQEEWATEDTRRDSMLNVVVGTIDIASASLACMIHITLQQFVQLLRKTNIRTPATTWDTVTIGIISAEKAQDHIREKIADGVDEFLNDYLAENPRK